MSARRGLLVFIIAFGFAASLPAADLWTFRIDPCTGEALKSGCKSSDVELAQWAFNTWQRESGGAIEFRQAPPGESARLTVHWATGASLYGEARPVEVDGQRGAELYILPGANTKPTTEPLLRDTIVYLTFVHETGHALGLRHTVEFADIMYSFQYGGDIDEYFGRYRRLLKKRSDIAVHSGISDADRAALRLVTLR